MVKNDCSRWAWWPMPMTLALGGVDWRTSGWKAAGGGGDEAEGGKFKVWTTKQVEGESLPLDKICVSKVKTAKTGQRHGSLLGCVPNTNADLGSYPSRAQRKGRKERKGGNWLYLRPAFAVSVSWPGQWKPRLTFSHAVCRAKVTLRNCWLYFLL